VTVSVTEIEAREAFHTLLLAFIPSAYREPTGVRPAPLRLKGGVNLRLFHASERFSEDIDFDLTPARGPQFLTQLRRLLVDPSFRRALLRVGIEDLTLSALEGGGSDSAGFKQKVRLIRGGVSLPTKIEGSYREETAPEEAVAAPIPQSFVARYRLGNAPIVAGYPAPVAICQKMIALSRRDPPQTRDMYDLDHLITTHSSDIVEMGRRMVLARLTSEQLRRASDTVLAFTRSQFEGQVVEFLPLSRQNDVAADWDRLQTRVWEWLVLVADHQLTPTRVVGNNGEG
jgi:hypothetical protein